MTTAKGNAYPQVVGAMCFAFGCMVMWATNVYGQDQVSPEQLPPTGSTQPAEAHFHSLGGHPPPKPLSPGCHATKVGTLHVEMIGPRATTLAKVNGINTRFILDTGGTFNLMSSATAASLGLETYPMPSGYRLEGIGGEVKAQQAFVDRLSIPGMSINRATFIVGGSDTGGALLGASLLDQADLEIDLAHGNMTLFREAQCYTPMAIWAEEFNVVNIEPSKIKTDHRTFLVVTINGENLVALLDSGAPSSVVSRSAAKRAGIDVKTAEGKTGAGTGIGAKSVKEWTVDIGAFTVGTETIQNTQIQVIDGSIGREADMLLGADFLLAHHVYIAKAQNRMYFTYNGGRVFTNASTAPGSDTPDDVEAAANGGNPKNAADYFLRGQAHLSRDELSAALADLDNAIRLSPRIPAYYVARARAHEKK